MSLDVPVPIVAFREPPTGAHFPLMEAMACWDCWTCFSGRVYTACPSCTSTTVHSVEVLMQMRTGQSYEAKTLRELERLHVLKSA